MKAKPVPEPLKRVPQAEGRLPILRRKAGELLATAADMAGLVLGASGATVTAFFGKLAVAVLLGAVALGFFLRLASRKGVAKPASAAPPAPWWLRPAAACVSLVLVATLVEATDLPVRFHQPGFEPWHWALVLAAFALAYSLSSRAIGALLKTRKRNLPQS